MLFDTPAHRAINLSIAVLLFALLGAGYWYAWRPLPQTSGEINAPISARATIVRDSLGVPHITASSWEDAIFLQGFVTAQDRMWQLDALRRFASGELAEVIGPDMLATDRESRRFLLSRIAEAQENLLSPEARKIYTLYARGVNHYLETNRGRLPIEFSLLNYEPRPWRVRDSILIGLQMYRTLTQNWQSEVRKMHLAATADPKKLAFLYGSRLGNDAFPGSNAWAISGTHTVTGKPILANDPHLEFTLPSTWYLVHLKGNDLDVTGASLPGIPAVLLGHNQRIAWGVTNLEFDVQDLVREQIDMQSGRYVYQGKLEQARPEREPIAIKGQKPNDGIAWVTRHGAVFFSEQNQNYALHWTAADFPMREFSFLALDRARNWEEFNAALRTYSGPGQNFVYADVEGNIGYHAAGVLPVRRGCDGSVPTDGASGECEWTGAIPYDELPTVFNPPGGLIVSANQNPFPHDYKLPVNGGFAPSYRAHGIQARLSSRDKWAPGEMLAVQKDVYSAYGYFLAQQTAEAWDREKESSPQLQEAADVLRKWDGQMELGAAAPMVISLMTPALQKAIAHQLNPQATEDDAAAITSAAIQALFAQKPGGWFDSYDRVLIDALKTAVSEGEKVQGSRVAAWDYGQSTRLTISNPIAGQIPVLGKYFNVGPVGMSGSPTSIKQLTRRLGPSMRMVVDLADLEGSQANITLGESGHLLSGHYKDQWNAFYSGTSFPMQYKKVTAESTLVVQP